MLIWSEYIYRSDNVCCVTGHRDIPPDKVEYVKQRLAEEVQRALDLGYDFFMSGFARGVDTFFAEIVYEYTLKNEDLCLIAALGYEELFNSMGKNRRRLLEACRFTRIAEGNSARERFLERDRYMVDNAKLVIAVYDGRKSGGTFYTMNYAKKMGRELRIIEI